MIRKVVINGPESTGKSTICEQLANRYQTLWVPEYAREYLRTRGPHYTYDDLLKIAQRQLALEDAYSRRLSNGMLFIDTNMYVMKVWCEYVFGKCHQWILDQIATRTYDLYFLMTPDLPWVHDELREYPDPATRRELFHIYRSDLLYQHVPWTEIRGGYAERLHSAISAIEGIRMSH